jgi:hypothetical protein
MYPWQSGYVPRRPRPLPQPTTEEMLRHLARYFSDQNIIKDIDTAVDACATAGQGAVVQAYGKARRNAAGFKPLSYGHNSHKAIPEGALEVVRRSGETEGSSCPQCGAPFVASDQRRRYCSTRCQQAARRVKDRVNPRETCRRSRKRETTAEKPQVRGLRSRQNRTPRVGTPAASITTHTGA